MTVDAVRRALRQRRHKPMFIVDIAVPRDVEPAVAELDDVYLYTIDDLQQVVDDNLGKRSEAAREAVPIVEEAADAFIRWLNGSRAADSLQLMREAAHGHSRELVERALRRLEAGHDPKSVLEQMGATLANRILHAPSKHLRQAAEQDDLDLLAAINQIFAPDAGPTDSVECAVDDGADDDENEAKGSCEGGLKRSGNSGGRT